MCRPSTRPAAIPTSKNPAISIASSTCCGPSSAIGSTRPCCRRPANENASCAYWEEWPNRARDVRMVGRLPSTRPAGVRRPVMTEHADPSSYSVGSTQTPWLLDRRRLLSREQALAFWFGRINYEERVPQPCDLKLDRMRELLKRLGDPQRRLRIVHVAGSKGKGSTSALLDAILRQAGYRTGLFTSPHLSRVEERIQVDGQPISSEELTALLSEICQATGGQEPTASASSTAPPLAPTFFEVA